jgi:hypothetical protein
VNFTFKRILASFLIGLVVAGITSEVAYRLLKRENREPNQIQLVIPAGTAQLVREGSAPPQISKDLNLVVGDMLVVVNQDNVDHQLGSLWIPAGASASMELNAEESYMLDCSFQPEKFQGIEVRQPVTWSTRVTGLLFAGFPLGALFAIYSGLIPSKKKKETEA